MKKSNYDSTHNTYTNNLKESKTVFGRYPHNLSQDILLILREDKQQSRACRVLGHTLWLKFLHECGKISDENYKKVQAFYKIYNFNKKT